MSSSSEPSSSPSSPSPCCSTIAAAVMGRIRGPDPQRRKCGTSSFFSSVDGVTTLTNTGVLFIGRHNNAMTMQVYVACNADIIRPFMRDDDNPSSSSASSSLPCDVSLDVLVDYDPLCSNSSGALAPLPSAARWWSCSLLSLRDVPDVDASIAQLTNGGADWELGWSAVRAPPIMPHFAPSPPSYDNDQSADPSSSVESFSGGGNRTMTSSTNADRRSRRSAGTIAILRVNARTADVNAEKQRRRKGRHGTNVASSIASSPSSSSSSWPSHYPPIFPSTFPRFALHPWLSPSTPIHRGAEVCVLSSPYGLLSVDIFHNTLTKGIVSNLVRLPARDTQHVTQERTGTKSGVAQSVSSHFGSNTTTRSEATQPPSLLLLDARCFAGSEGAPVLLAHPNVNRDGASSSSPICSSSSSSSSSSCCVTCSNPPPLLAMITLPIRHTRSGSSVELNLAIPIASVQRILRDELNIEVWTPLPERTNDEASETKSALSNDKPSASSLSSSVNQTGRGEGWRIAMQCLRDRFMPSTVVAPVDSTSTTAVVAASNVAHHASAPSSLTNPRTPAPLSLLPLSSTLPFHSSPTRHGHESSSPKCASPAAAVDRAQRSVLIARIGGSWASSIVLTEDGYLLTNAHLLRPFMPCSEPSSSSTASSAPSTSAAGSAFTPSLSSSVAPAVARSIHLSAQVSVRLDAHHFRSYSSSNNDSEHDDAPVGWHNAQVLYVSSGPWDVALMKVQCAKSLCPIQLHTRARRKSSIRDQPHMLPLPPLGSSVLAIGHALFAPASTLLPTVTMGVLSKVVRLPTPSTPSSVANSPQLPPFPALLATSAAVHNGNSGGLLIDASTGYLIGMVTSNVMHTPVEPNHFPTFSRSGDDSVIQGDAHDNDNDDRTVDDKRTYGRLKADYELSRQREESRRKATYGHVDMILPHLNFSIPYTALMPLIQYAEDQGRDASLLQSIDDASSSISRLWALTDIDVTATPQPNFSPNYYKLMDELRMNEPEVSPQLVTVPITTTTMK